MNHVLSHWNEVNSLKRSVTIILILFSQFCEQRFRVFSVEEEEVESEAY